MSRAKLPSFGFLMLIGTGLIWGTIGIAAKYLYQESDLDAVSVTWLRAVMASPICIAIAWRATSGRLFRMPGRDFSIMVFLGVILIDYQFFYLAAINRIGISAATLISLCGAPVFVVIASTLFLKSSLSGRTALALSAALVGTAMIVGWHSGGTGDTRDTMIGVALSVGSAAGIATHVFVSRLIAGRHHSSIPLAIGFPAGALVFMPFAVGRGISLDLNAVSWSLLVYLAIGPSVIAYWMYQRGLQEVTATDASIVTLLEPLIAAILAAFLFDEQLGLLGWIGAILLVGSIAVLSLMPSRDWKMQASPVVSAGEAVT
jgi:DME family drug/metabolite transporter